MNLKLGAKVAALVGGAALAATPAFAQMHSGGGHFGGGGGAGHVSSGGHMSGGGHFAGGGFRGAPAGGAFHPSPMAGAVTTSHLQSGTWRPGTWRPGTWGDGDGDWDDFRGGCCGFWGPWWGGWWGDPFFWGGAGFAAGYALAPAYYDYDVTDDYSYGAGSAPPGYDCDGWRWDPGKGRYIPAKVACN